MTRTLCALVAIAAFTVTVRAHRLDDYLQTARLDVSPTGVTVELDLTPGAAIASAIVPTIDADRDGLVSVAEIERYARAVLADVQRDVDGLPRPLTLTRAESPTTGEFHDGVGVIRINAQARLELMPGTHRIRFQNRHRRDVGVYMANALMPSTQQIAIVRQQRDPQQRHFELDVEVTSTKALRGWIVAQVLIAGFLLARRASVRFRQIPLAMAQPQRGIRRHHFQRAIRTIQPPLR